MKAEILAQPAHPTWQDRWAKGLFWSWNIIFMAFMLLGFGPKLIPEILIAVRTGIIGWQFLVYAMVLAMIPAVAIVLGWTVFNGQPRVLFALGYVVEGPLMLMLAVRFFAVRQASTALSFLMLIAGLGMAAFFWYALSRWKDDQPVALAGLQLFGLSLMALVSLYAAVWISFYALPGAYYLFEMIRSFIEQFRQMFRDVSNLPANLVWMPFSLLGSVLLIFTGILIILAPAAVPYLSLKAWWKASKSLLRGRSGRLAAGAAWLAAAAIVALFVLANRQPQQEVFARLQKPPQTAEAARDILQQSASIRRGLLNAYLAPFRYISSVGEVNHIRGIYIQVFHLPEEIAARIQGAYEWVARPLLYNPYEKTETPVSSRSQPRFAFEREPAMAARLYQRVFDKTIVEGERETILAAARSTWSVNAAESALQTLDERQVHLERQEISVQEHGDWAEIELYEVYRNTTADRQEVIYYFSLPESAVVTGVWLGESPDRARRHAYIVAPRGAAQAVYREQVRRAMDPALVEQIGPRQYRLRIFPILPLEQTYDQRTERTTVGEAPPLHLWMTWKTFSKQQRWPLPRLTLKRNVFWDRETVRLVNGQPSQTVEEAAWMAPFVEPLTPVALEVHEARLPGGYTIQAQPANSIARFELPDDVRLAVVVDRSRSMEQLAPLAGQALSQLAKLASTQIDLYLTASPFRGEEPVRVSLTEISNQPLDFVGGQDPAQLLVQFAELRSERKYDAVIVITDGSGYELGPTPFDVPAFDVPVWMVHIGDQIPIGYDDQTLEAVQSSGGGIVGSLDEAIERIAAGRAAQSTGSDGVWQDVIDGYVWTMTQNETDTTPPAADGFSSLAARRAILAEMLRNRGKLDNARILDRLHVIAVSESIVTPYSSMIVLVSDEQEALLRRLSEKDDRFQREVEDLGETTPATQTPLTGVPEPEEWLLIAVASLALAYALLTRGRLTGRAVHSGRR